MRHLPPKRLFVILLLVSTLLGNHGQANACGPFARDAIFTYIKHPDFPLDGFARGQLGVIEPSYARSYLFVAYRYMNGLSFTAAEQQALVSLWRDRFSYDWENTEEDGMKKWLTTRKRVKSAGPDPQIEVYRPTGKEQYDSFLNCPSDAFANAALTLEARIKQFGAESAEVRDWLQAQDKVFANCGGGESVPEEASGSSQLVRADRAYQIAAAKFYAMRFDEARTDFEKIAGDSSSPWHETARYLVARSLIRKASLGTEEQRSEILAQAESELKRTMTEIKQGPLHDSARGLLNLVKLRYRPEERLRELAQSLMKGSTNPTLKQELWDYTLLLDRFLGDGEEPPDEKLAKNVATATGDDLSDWLRTFQSESTESKQHALSRWRATDSQAWLVAALSKAEGAGENTTALINAADRIVESSPAYATANFHVLRLLMEAGDRAGAITRLDGILKQGQSSLPASARNQFLHQRMMVASTLEEFLRFAQRRPAAFSWGDDGREIPIEPKELNQDTELKQIAGLTLFDTDSTAIMNDRLPLSVFQEAVRGTALPEHLRRRLALAAWTRAVMLDNTEAAKALAPVLASLAPEMRALLNEYAGATDANRKALGIYTLLKFPGSRPYVDPGVGRFTPLSRRDVYRDNWWCDRTPRAESSEAVEEGAADASTSKAVSKTETWQLDFLTAEQRAAAARERTQLLSLGPAPNYLSREVIEWAKRAPNNPRVPEALHIAVMTTRYGCTDKDSGPLSRAAWQLLHTRYKNSAWAKKTPYWFNN